MSPVFTQFSEYYQKYHIGKVLIGCIIIYALFLRFYHLGIQSFWIDEGFSSYSTLTWTNTRYLLHNISQWLSFQVFGVSDWSARFPSIIFSLATIPVLYYLSNTLFGDKRINIGVILVFCFFYLEITWARQARFYTLLQLLFYLNLYLATRVYHNPNWKNIGIGLILLLISLDFHPFLYVNGVVFVLITGYSLIQQKTVPLGYILFGLGVIVSSGVYVYYRTIQRWFERSDSALTPEITQNYIQSYSNHFLSQSGWLYILFIISFFIIVLRRDFLKICIIPLVFLLSFYIISQKGVMYHTRYVFHLFPLVFLGGLYTYFYCGDLIKRQGQTAYYLLIGAVLVIGLNLSFSPKTYYWLDYTSPQVDFKSAYQSIGEGEDIISGFPVMCEWYYRDRGNCEYALAINYVGTPESREKILARGQDNYTSLPYINNISQLENGNEYYFVLDDLSNRRMISRELHKEIFENGNIIYNEGTKYKNIQIIEYTK